MTGVPGAERACRDAGFDRVLLKPCDPTALIHLLGVYAAYLQA